MALRAVAFDVDGTLYPNSSMYLLSLGLAVTSAPLLKALEAARNQLRDAPQPDEEFHRVQARLVAARMGISPDRAFALIEGRVYTHWFRVFRRLRPFAGLTEAVAAFRQRGLKTAVLSDFPIRRRLDDLGLVGPWDCAFSSEETGYLKPHPQPFRALADRLGLSPDEVLYVGNSYRYDVLGAQAAGMPCAHLTKRPPEGSPAVLNFHDYRALSSFVFRVLDDPGYNGFQGREPTC